MLRFSALIRLPPARTGFSHPGRTTRWACRVLRDHRLCMNGHKPGAATAAGRRRPPNTPATTSASPTRHLPHSMMSLLARTSTCTARSPAARSGRVSCPRDVPGTGRTLCCDRECMGALNGSLQTKGRLQFRLLTHRP